ncbi:hypothetical protein T03_4918 [Trichinella britovi]|uniref:Uncharacterized protein n=1 Tax=Trichinella britovi TaxID=45882 RepID=A0A0V1CCM2_TRIBR|nr:hypothetical protein T03_4918 [Trichinella britovi]
MEAEMDSVITNTGVSGSTLMKQEPFRCSLSSPQLYQGQFSHLPNVSCNLTVRFKSASARCRSQRVSVLHSRLIAAPSHPAALNACDRCSFFAATVSNSSLMGVQNYHLLPYTTVRLCAFQRRIPAQQPLNVFSRISFLSSADPFRSLESTFITETDGYVTLLIIILIKLNPPSIVGFSPVSTLLFSNSNNWRSEDCIVLSFISEAFAYRLKEEAPEMDVRCKFR